MRYHPATHMAFLVDGGRKVAEPKIDDQLRKIEGGEYVGATGYWGDNISYSYATVHANSRSEAELLAWERVGQAIRAAGYKATPGWFVEPYVSDEEQQQYDGWHLRQELMDHFDDEGKCTCVDDPTHGDLIPLEHVRHPA